MNDVTYICTNGGRLVIGHVGIFQHGVPGHRLLLHRCMEHVHYAIIGDKQEAAYPPQSSERNLLIHGAGHVGPECVTVSSLGTCSLIMERLRCVKHSAVMKAVSIIE